MCKDCCCNDDREAEHDLDVLEAKGKFHKVTIRVTLEATVDVPGSDHDTEDLQNHLDEVISSGEIVDWEEQ